jgi:rhodanese-related sulfurtransferase
VAYLRQRGHDAVNLEGGMVDWEAAGRPLVSETGEPPKVV